MDAKVLLVAGILVVAAVGGVAAYKFIIDPDPDHTPTLTEFKGNEVVSLNTYKSSPGMTINDPGHLVKGMDYTETQSCMIFHISNINDWFLGAIDVTDGDGTTATFSQSNSKTLSKSISNQVMRGISNSSTIGNENTKSYSLTTQSGFEFTEGGSLSASVTAGVETPAIFGVTA